MDDVAVGHSDAVPLVGRNLTELATGERETVSDPIYFMTDDEPSRGLNQENIFGVGYDSVDVAACTERNVLAMITAGAHTITTTFIERSWAASNDTTGGGKGFGGPTVTTTTYAYFANFAVALCEGPVSRIGRIWMDGREIDQRQVTLRTYLGTETQPADSLMVAKEGSDNAPAYRGTAYVVFERLPLEQYGNRMPVVTAEVFRSVGTLEPLVKGVALIPG